MEGYRERQELRHKIINSLPDGFKKHLNDSLVHNYIERMVSMGTHNTGDLLVALLDSRQDIMERFKKYIECGAPPHYIVGTQEMIDKIKALEK